MEHHIKDYIEAKIARYKKVIADEELYQRSGGTQGQHCINVPQLKERMATWTEDDWLDHLEQSMGGYYQIDRTKKTYTLIRMPGAIL